MIIDQLKNISYYKKLSDGFNAAFAFIEETDLNSLSTGKYVIKDDRVFAIVSEYETRDPKEIDWETHKKYIDIQILINGEERIGYTWLDNLTLEKDYNTEKDIMFFRGNGEYITLKKGFFTIFFPHDAHKPGLNTDKKMNVKKLVIKVLNK